LATIALCHDVPAPGAAETILRPPEARALFTATGLFANVLRYRQSRLLIDRLDGLLSPKPVVAVRALSRGECWIEDAQGDRLALTWRRVFLIAVAALRDALLVRRMLRTVEKDVSDLERTARPSEAVLERGGAIYLRSDLWFGVKAGGSVGHIAGVVNNLEGAGGRPLLITTDHIPTIRPGTETMVVRPCRRWWPNVEWHQLAFNRFQLDAGLARCSGRRVSFVYQRYSLHNYVGLALARRLGVPFVLEYNGSELWVARNWGNPLREEALGERIELLNLRGADLVTVVSEPLRRELLSRGVDGQRILVNPNGVDPDVFSPTIDGSAVRLRHGLEGKTVIGFIGTYGPWHGAEVLAEAFGRLLSRRPSDRDRVRLMLIGNGTGMPETRRILARHGALGETVFTGLVPQEEGPVHLAACDVLVSPHVPNRDGSPFFGSPTKLFEYMAMGRGIVASSLGQIAEVLEHERTALLVEPGDPDALASALERLMDNPDLAWRLGRNARERAVERHTWTAHVGHVLAGLEAVLR
jgi:glycosyltransferase involved in cell wall biosynthesis